MTEERGRGEGEDQARRQGGDWVERVPTRVEGRGLRDLVRAARARVPSSAYLEAQVDGAGRGIDGEGVSAIRVASLEEGDVAAVAVHEVGGGEARDARAHHRHRPALGGGRHRFRRGNARVRGAARAGRRVTRERVRERGRESFTGGYVRPRGSNVASVGARDVGMPEGTSDEVFCRRGGAFRGAPTKATFSRGAPRRSENLFARMRAQLEHPRVRIKPRATRAFSALDFFTFSVLT